jgi:hypothetical protein
MIGLLRLHALVCMSWLPGYFTSCSMEVIRETLVQKRYDTCLSIYTPYMKKILLYINTCVMLFLLMWGCISFSHAQIIRGEEDGFGSVRQVVEWGTNIAGTDEFQEQWLINVIKWAINWVLWILGLIALIIVMIGWFRMVTAAGNEDQYNSGFAYLKNAAIGLAIIWVAWFIVSMAFWVFNLISTEALE